MTLDITDIRDYYNTCVSTQANGVLTKKKKNMIILIYLIGGEAS